MKIYVRSRVHLLCTSVVPMSFTQLCTTMSMYENLRAFKSSYTVPADRKPAPVRGTIPRSELIQ